MISRPTCSPRRDSSNAPSSRLDADAVFDAGPRGIEIPNEYGWVRDTLLPDGRWRIAPAVMLQRLAEHRDPLPGIVLVPRRDMAWSNFVRYGGAGAEPLARISPADATTAGLSDRDRVTLASTHGAISATVTVDDHVMPGVVSFTHGHPDQSPGALVSSTEGVDPLTAMPQASGVPVTLTRDRTTP